MSERKRKCWDCGNVAMHESDITHGVLCSKCGSQDTRLVREVPLHRADTSSDATNSDFSAYAKAIDMLKRVGY